MKELINKLCWSKTSIKADMVKEEYYISLPAVIVLLEECARLQRKLCADNADTKTIICEKIDYEYDIVDLDTIINAPQPEIK